MYIIIPRKKVFCTSETQNTLLHGPVRPALLRYAFPIILSMVATQFYSVADTMIIGLRLDADALARAVLQVLHSPDGGTAMGRAARARALQTHDAARNAADLLHIYESILQEEHP